MASTLIYVLVRKCNSFEGRLKVAKTRRFLVTLFFITMGVRASLHAS